MNSYLRTEEEEKYENMKSLACDIVAGLLIAPLLYAVSVLWFCI